MNRKQKVAIVLGALVIAGLALFPPTTRYGLDWVFSRIDFNYAKLHSLQATALVLTVAAVLVLKDKKA